MAYDKVRTLSRELPADIEEFAKVAAMTVREALVLEVCCTSGPLSDVGFITELEQAFGRQLGPQLCSQ